MYNEEGSQWIVGTRDNHNPKFIYHPNSTLSKGGDLTLDSDKEGVRFPVTGDFNDGVLMFSPVEGCGSARVQWMGLNFTLMKSHLF